MTVRLGTRSHGDCERIAGEVRALLDIGSDPLYELAGAAEQFGLYSCSLPLGDGGTGGALVEVTEGCAAVVIDGDARPGRRRMSLTHEKRALAVLLTPTTRRQPTPSG